MIKAVFFDWFNTLANYSPPREELQSRVLSEFGFNVAPDKLLPALLSADKVLFDLHADNPVTKRPPEEQAKIYAQYQMTILSEVHIDISSNPDLLPKILKRTQELYKDIKFVLYDDVIPTLKTIREKDLTIGILTNIESGMEPICKELGLEPYIDIIVTSGEAGADKPQPKIFLLALEKAGVEANEAIHVGDQPKIDIAGAKGAGINPLLLDRFNLYSDIDDCPVIHQLGEVTGYLQ
ncbi:HAD family hydrolase [Chloroflexota bacterium]